MACRTSSGEGQAGFTYLGILIAIAVMGIGLMAVSEVWTTTAERQKMAQLEWVGQQYVRAIGSYYYSNTGSVHYYPASLEDLLEDKRHLSIKRHIRNLYPDPFSNRTSWTLVPASEGGIMGISFTRKDGEHSAVVKQFVFAPSASGP